MTTVRPFGLKRGRPAPGFTFTGEIADFRGTGRGEFYFHFHRASENRFITPIGRRSRVDMADDESDAVDLTDRHDRWRWTCPRQHTDWEPTNHHFWCASCARAGPETEGRFDALHDRVTGDELAREDVRLVTEAGPYDRDLDREGAA